MILPCNFDVRYKIFVLFSYYATVYVHVVHYRPIIIAIYKGVNPLRTTIIFNYKNRFGFVVFIEKTIMLCIRR